MPKEAWRRGKAVYISSRGVKSRHTVTLVDIEWFANKKAVTFPVTTLARGRHNWWWAVKG
jgi:hypothetical protein